MPRPSVVIAGSLSQKPKHGGHTWALLQYALGFRELGWEVLFLDQISSSLCVDSDGRRTRAADSINVQFLDGLMRRFGFGGHYTLIVDGGEVWLGVGRTRVLERVRNSNFLLNIMGFLSQPDVLSAAQRRVFLDIDPGFGQMWKDLGLHDPFAGHDTHVTIGERIGQPDCRVPVCGLEWITTPPLVVLSYWPVVEGPFHKFTSVASWRGAYGPIEYHGRTYGLRVHEFRKFIDLPRRTALPFELALDIHVNDGRDRERLESTDWTLVNPMEVTGSPEHYQEYVQSSSAEFMVAKALYVDTRSGWLSDRSLCYLASGKPVLAQDTGWPLNYDAGTGIVPFTSLDDAEEGARSIARDYAHHARAARALAEEHFDAKRVLSRLVANLSA